MLAGPPLWRLLVYMAKRSCSRETTFSFLDHALPLVTRPRFPFPQSLIYFKDSLKFPRFSVLVKVGYSSQRVIKEFLRQEYLFGVVDKAYIGVMGCTRFYSSLFQLLGHKVDSPLEDDKKHTFAHSLYI